MTTRSQVDALIAAAEIRSADEESGIPLADLAAIASLAAARAIADAIDALTERVEALEGREDIEALLSDIHAEIIKVKKAVKKQK